MKYIAALITGAQAFDLGGLISQVENAAVRARGRGIKK